MESLNLVPICDYNAKIFTIDMSGTVLTTILTDISGAIGGINLSTNNQQLLYNGSPKN